MYRMVLRHDVGGQAPGFALKDGTGREATLEGFRPSVVLLVFFTGGFDRDAVKGLRELVKGHQRILDSDAVLVAITPELPGKVQTLVESLGLPFAVLSDPEMKVVKEYDVYDQIANWTWPAAFIIDKEGIIQYAFRGASPPNTPPVDYIMLKLARMKEEKAPTAAGEART